MNVSYSWKTCYSVRIQVTVVQAIIQWPEFYGLNEISGRKYSK